MIIAANSPITIRRGDTSTYFYQMATVATEDTPSKPIDITEWTLTGKAKFNQTLEWLDFPIVKTDPVNGKFEMFIDKDTSENLAAIDAATSAPARYEVQTEVPNGGTQAVATILEGTFEVVRDLVRGN